MKKAANKKPMVREPSDIGRRLARALQDRGMSARELAKETGLHESTISRMLNNDRVRASHRTITAIADALDVDPEDLTGEAKRHLREVPPEEASGLMDPAELLSLYMASDHAQRDRPTVEEIRYLLSLTLAWTGRPPTAKTASALIHRKRSKTS